MYGEVLSFMNVGATTNQNNIIESGYIKDINNCPLYVGLSNLKSPYFFGRGECQCCV